MYLTVKLVCQKRLRREREEERRGKKAAGGEVTVVESGMWEEISSSVMFFHWLVGCMFNHVWRDLRDLES